MSKALIFGILKVVFNVFYWVVMPVTGITLGVISYMGYSTISLLEILPMFLAPIVLSTRIIVRAIH